MDLIVEHFKIIAIVAGAITAFFVAWGHIGKFLKPYIKSMRESMKARHEMPYMIKKIGETLDNIENRVKKVEYEITPNHGSSMKDAMRIIKAEIEATNWLSPRPSFRTTSFGINTFVNEAYCNLCGASPTELLKLGWKNFIQDPEEGDDFMRRWLESSSVKSQFSGTLTLKNSDEECVGEWICKLKPLGPLESDSDNYLWHGYLYPHDKVAIDYAHEYNIPIK